MLELKTCMHDSPISIVIMVTHLKKNFNLPF